MSNPGHDELLDDIAATREQLGSTVEELAHRLDVKAQVDEKVAETKEAVHEKIAGTKEAVHDTVVATKEAVQGKTVGARAAALGLRGWAVRAAGDADVRAAAIGALVAGLLAAVLMRRS